MTLRHLPHFAFAASFLLASASACGGDKPAEPTAAPATPAPEPAPAPAAPAPSVAPAPEAPAPANSAAAPAAPEHPAAPEPAAHVAKPTRDSDTSVPTPAAAKHAQTPASQPSTKVVPPAPAPVPAAAAPETKPPPSVAVAPAKPVEPPAPVAPAPAPPAASKVVVPRTDHVHIDVPKGLQVWLDADTRMEPWLGKVIKVIDACYANARKDDPNTAGVIVVKITMHKDERPDADIASSPSQLGGVVGCATTKLLGARPPLFTGKEGEKYTVQIHFDK